MFDSVGSVPPADIDTAGLNHPSRTLAFRVVKRGFDILMALALLPLLLAATLLLLVLNPWLNPGGLFYVQRRMGRHCQPFRAFKFRSMLPVAEIARGPFDPVEAHRITRLGRFMRKTRIDELPQIINVLRGEMSMIGPRPDFYDHAVTYVETIPGYRERHTALPGITGYAQVEVGYVEAEEGVARKVEADLHYIRNLGFALETYIAWRTVLTVLRFQGS